MFHGFSEDTLAFFTALRFNNNRDFFEENRQVYEDAVRKPLLALAEDLAPVVQKIDPLLDVRPGRVVSRIHRDLRFRRDKTPYREYMWIGYRRVGESREETCGFYFDLSANAANWGCGYYHMMPDVMQRLRQLMVDDPGRVRKVVTAKAFAERFALCGDSYVRQHQPPEGMKPPLDAMFRMKSVFAEHHVADIAELFSPELVTTITKDFEILAPFYDMLRECMVKTTREVDA